MDYCIRYIDLPCKINGTVAQDNDGFYNIYINSKLSYEAQQKAIRHELTHIQRNDFYRNESLELIENIWKRNKYRKHKRKQLD